MPKTVTIKIDECLLRPVGDALGAVDSLHAVSRALGLAKIADSYAWQEGERRVLRILTPDGRAIAVALNMDWPAEDDA